MNSRAKIQFTFCHQKPERSFFWKGKQLPVCARCTGIYIGYLTFPFFLFGLFSLNLQWTLIFILPTCIDGGVQVIFHRESNNYLRLITGILAGIGAMSLVAIVGQGLGHLILSLFKL